MQEAESLDFQQEEVDSYVTKWKTWPEIRERLLDGEASIGDIAKWLQATETEACDRNTASLERILRRVRQKLRESKTQGKLAELQRKADEAQAKEAGPGKVSTYVDVLESLAELFSMQLERIKMGRTIEQKVNYLLTKLTQDIGEAREILKFMFEVQQELGIAKRKPLQFEGKLAVLTFDQRQQVSKVLELVKQRVLAKELESKVAREVAEEVVEQVVVEQVSTDNDKVIDVEPTDDRMTRRTDHATQIADKFVDPQAGGKSDLPWE